MKKLSVKALFGRGGAAKERAVSAIKSGNPGGANGEELAAIAFALCKYTEEMNGRGNSALTISRVPQSCSSWNSKTYGLRTIPNKK